VSTVARRTWRCRDHGLEVGRRTLVMCILNVTPDSFSDGGRFLDPGDAVARAVHLLDDGADILDIGGESTRPGAAAVSVEEELRRVVPVVQAMHAARPGVVISVDTRRAVVAQAALDAGAAIVNDVSAGADPDMFDVVGSIGAGMVLMHMRGAPATMQDDPTYDDVVADVHAFLRERVEAATSASIGIERLAVDPGIGFGKDLHHNLALIRSLAGFTELGVVLAVGVSRKRFIGTLTGVDDPTDRVDGSVAAGVLAAANGADVVRTHDVRPTVRALAVADAIVREVGR